MIGNRLFWSLLISFVLVYSYPTSGTDFISYHKYTDPIMAFCDATSSQSRWGGYITANSKDIPCGSCIKMTSGSKTIYVISIDKGGRGFDLNQPAFCELCGEAGGFAAGGCNVNWEIVDYNSNCVPFFQGKTKPWCDMCPAGSTCGNPDPNRNMGVNWDAYCPQVASPDGMTRCFMRIDGCKCYGGTPPKPTPTKSPTTPPTTPPKPTPTMAPITPPTTPPTTPPKTTPTMAPITPPTGKPETTRCGASWGLANTQCNKPCKYPEDCPAGHNCFADLTSCVWTGATEDQVATNIMSESQNIGIIAGTIVGFVTLTLLIIVIYWKKTSKRQEEIA